MGIYLPASSTSLLSTTFHVLELFLVSVTVSVIQSSKRSPAPIAFAWVVPSTLLLYCRQVRAVKFIVQSSCTKSFLYVSLLLLSVFLIAVLSARLQSAFMVSCTSALRAGSVMVDLFRYASACAISLSGSGSFSRDRATHSHATAVKMSVAAILVAG